MSQRSHTKWVRLHRYETKRTLLEKVEGVVWVVKHRKGSKREQGNESPGHRQQHNWEVMTRELELNNKNAFEFEVTLPCASI